MGLEAVAPIGEIDGPYEDPAVGAAAEGQARARREGHDFDELAYDYLVKAGGDIVRAKHLVDDWICVDARVRGPNGAEFWVLAHGNVDDKTRSGFRRTDTSKKAYATAAALHSLAGRLPVLTVTSHLPRLTQPGATRWVRLLDTVVFDVIAVTGDLAGYQRLHRYFTETPALRTPLPAPWRTDPRGAPLDFDRIEEAPDA